MPEKLEKGLLNPPQTEIKLSDYKLTQSDHNNLSYQNYQKGNKYQHFHDCPKGVKISEVVKIAIKIILNSFKVFPPPPKHLCTSNLMNVLDFNTVYQSEGTVEFILKSFIYIYIYISNETYAFGINATYLFFGWKQV